MRNTRRIHPRIPTNFQIEYEEFERFHPDKLLNLSAGGAFILTPKPLPLKRHFCFKFYLPELPKRPLKACASVVWLPPQKKGAPKNHHPMGMGVEFDFTDTALLRLLDQYVTVQAGLRSIDTRVGKELPSHIQSELSKPQGEAIEVDVLDLVKPGDIKV